MQDIPRNELLDKLAAGWKVRRKKWSADNTFSVKGQQSVFAKALIADDWEGEPPAPVRKYEGCAITFAFEHLQKGAAFIRRTAWADRGPITPKAHSYVHVSDLDILATDWEVWG